MENQENPLELSKSTSHRLQRSVTAIALIALLLDALIVRALILLAPFIRSNLGIDESQFGYFMSALMLGTLLTTLPIGSLLERCSTRWAFGTMMTVTGIGLFLVAYQSTFHGLIAALFFVGILRAGIVPLTNHVIAEYFASGQRGSITGFIFAAVPLGGFLGALVLPALGETFNWGAGYQLLGIVALIGGILAWILLPREKGYVYFQEFIPNKKTDTRMIAIGDRCFGTIRHVRKNDFRASGSGVADTSPNLFDKRTINKAFEIRDKVSAQTLAFDFLHDHDDIKVVEMSYGFPVIASDNLPGYWDRDMNWHEGLFKCQYWMIENFISEIVESKKVINKL